MKVYLITHKGKPYWHKLESWVDVKEVGKNGISVISVRAFVKRKYAKEWLKKNNIEHLEIKSATL